MGLMRGALTPGPRDMASIENFGAYGGDSQGLARVTATERALGAVCRQLIDLSKRLGELERSVATLEGAEPQQLD